MITLVVCILLALATVVVAAAIRGDFTRRNASENIADDIRHVDMLALNNLLNPQEEDFLRRTLPSHAFHRVRRMRTRALIEYVRAIACNAALAMHWSELARSSPDPMIVAAANTVGRTAIEVRLRSLQAICVLSASIVFPNIRTENLLPLQTYGRLKAIFIASGAVTSEAFQIASQL